MDDIPDIARKLGEAEPDAVVHLCVAGRGTIPMLVSIGARLPGVPVLASSGILALPELALPPEPERASRPWGRRSSRSAPATRPCALVLDAIERGGRDRRRVIAAGLELGRALATGRVVVYRPGPDGHFARAQARFSSR